MALMAGNPRTSLSVCDDVGEPAHGTPRPRATSPEAAPVRRASEPEQQRRVEGCVDEDPARGPERQHEHAAHARPHQHAEVARGRVEANRALERGRADDVVEQNLAGGAPEDTGAAVEHQQHHRVPDAQAVGQEQISPRQRHAREQHAADLDEAPRVEAIVERADGHREEQERQPVRHHREPAERWRMELLEHEPVADDVLDVVRHHREHECHEVGGISGDAERAERTVRARGGAGIGAHVGILHGRWL